MRRFNQYLYDDPLDAFSDEEETIHAKAYGEAVGEYGEQLREIIEVRRAKVLPKAISAFNKIQGKDIPLWLRPGGELNAEPRAGTKARRPPDFVE